MRRKCKLALDTISREKRKRQDGSAYTPRGPIAAPDVLRQQLQQEGGMASPEQMPMPESLLCDSCKEYQPISSMAEDPNMPGILRCLACRTALAAYGQQQMEIQQEVTLCGVCICSCFRHCSAHFGKRQHPASCYFHYVFHFQNPTASSQMNPILVSLDNADSCRDDVRLNEKRRRRRESKEMKWVTLFLGRVEALGHAVCFCREGRLRKELFRRPMLSSTQLRWLHPPGWLPPRPRPCTRA